MPTLTIELTDSSLQALRSYASERLITPENIAAAAVEDFVLQSVLLDRRARDAVIKVDRRAHVHGNDRRG